MTMSAHDVSAEVNQVGRSSRERTKVCPRCGAMLFEDMNQCFGCLYDFERDQSTRSTSQEAVSCDDTGTLYVAAKHLAPESRALALRVCTPQLIVTCPITREGLSIGRGAENDVVICNRMVSRRHVRVFRSKTCAVVEDQGATNPALVDGEQLIDARELYPGSTLDVCGITCVVIPMAHDD